MLVVVIVVSEGDGMLGLFPWLLDFVIHYVGALLLTQCILTGVIDASIESHKALNLKSPKQLGINYINMIRRL